MKGETLMKKILVLLLVILLLALMIQVALADPPGPVPASCNMGASWWVPENDEDTGPGNANGVSAGERGMYNVHFGTNPHHGAQGPDDYYTPGAANMDIICPG
jgi:hypothetical protein